MRLLSLCALQITPIPGDLEATLEHFEHRVRVLAQTFPGVQLIVAPELHLAAVGGIFDEETGHTERAAVDVPGPLTDRLGALARETGLWLVPGSIYERAAGGGAHNTAVVLSPDGELVATYRKCFPWQPYEESVPRTSFTTFDMPAVWRVEPPICHGASSPDVFRALAWAGAEVVLQPTL